MHKEPRPSCQQGQTHDHDWDCIGLLAMGQGVRCQGNDDADKTI